MSDDIASAVSENEEAKRIRERVLQWDDKENPLAPLTPDQIELCERMEILVQQQYYDAADVPEREEDKIQNIEPKKIDNLSSKIYDELHEQFKNDGITSTELFLHWYDKISEERNEKSNDKYHKYMKELQSRSDECQQILDQIDTSIDKLHELEKQYEFVSNKTSSLNLASEQLTQEQKQLNAISEEIQRRLYYFNQAEHLTQRLQSPTLSVASDSFRECLNKIDECLEYLRQNPKFKESSSYLVKYKHCLARAVTLMKNYVELVINQATEQILTPKKSPNLGDNASSDAAFALYYGKFQTSAIKIKRIASMIEERIGQSPEYEQLLSEIHQNYLSERANIMSPAVEKAIKDLKLNNKGDHCSLMRNACAFLVHVCQDEHRLFFQFFTIASEQLNLYLEGLATLLYDHLRPYIIHINHLETLAEICSILRIEMLEEHVQQNPESLEAFGKTAFQLLQDVQERLVFRAHLYLQSDILNYNPSPGDLAYPDKLEMMESIALSLQEPQLKRSDSRSSITSATTIPDNESVVDNSARGRFINSPADLHGMWYPTVRRTLVCLSRLYRCIDRPIFQGLSQEALKYCIDSVSNASAKISANKTSIDGELFEIKHLLILREQIAPFRVDFTVKETSLDFSKVKNAAYGLLQKRKQLFTLNSNNAILEFLLDGTPQVKEQLLDSRKDVDRQLKTVCEQFIKDAVQMLVGPILQFLEKVKTALSDNSAALAATQSAQKLNLQLRQSQWASPQQISGHIQESQRLIKNKLSGLQRSMQLYLSNRDTEFIIFRPIRNNIISNFVKLEQILTANGYTQDDMIITSCPSAEQISILLSSASILADCIPLASSSASRKMSTSSNDGTRKISTSSNEGTRKISTSSNDGTTKIAGQPSTTNLTRKSGVEKKVSFDNSNTIVREVNEIREEII